MKIYAFFADRFGHWFSTYTHILTPNPNDKIHAYILMQFDLLVVVVGTLFLFMTKKTIIKIN